MVRITKIFIVLAILISVTIHTGCGIKKPQLLDYFTQPMDADRNGTIDDNDVSMLIAEADDYFDVMIRPFLDKAGAEIDESIRAISDNVEEKLKEHLTVNEWEQLGENLDGYNRMLAQIEITRRASRTASDLYDTGTAGHFFQRSNGDVVFWLKDGRKAQLIGIRIPVPTTSYSKMCMDFFEKMTCNKVVRMEHDTQRTDDTTNTLLVYLYAKDEFINAEMVERGYAYTLSMPPNNRYDEHFSALEEKAKADKLGIWKFMEIEK